MAGAKDFWHKSLQSLPKIDHVFIKSEVKRETPVKQSLIRAYKFFSESYIHDIRVKLSKSNDTGVTIKAKCYRSMKKNEDAHSLEVIFKHQDQPEVVIFKCSCAAGKGFCHHKIGLLYQLAHYEMLGLKTIPPDISKTSKPQTWHIPKRCDGITPRQFDAVVITKVKTPVEVEEGCKKRRVGVSSTVYKPFEAEVCNLNLPQIFQPLFVNSIPSPGFLRIWSADENKPPELVPTKYGPAPKGSILSYQQPEVKPYKSYTLDPSIHVPDFNLPTLPTLSTVLNEKELLFYESLTLSHDDSRSFEESTRQQSTSPTWHRLRKYRLTASNFKSICTRKKDFDTLSQRLLSQKSINTAAVRHGISHEDAAAQSYSQVSGNGVLPVGFVINPSAPHLGCSPDRRVYDPSETSPWGLLEIKCSLFEHLSELKYLKLDEADGKYHLRQSHQYYTQIMGCIGLSGSAWEDFYVECKTGEYHLERVYFDPDIFDNMLYKLNMFYFDFHLPFCVQH